MPRNLHFLAGEDIHYRRHGLLRGRAERSQVGTISRSVCRLADRDNTATAGAPRDQIGPQGDDDEQCRQADRHCLGEYEPKLAHENKPGRWETQRRARASTHYSPNGLVIEAFVAAPKAVCTDAGVAPGRCPDTSNAGRLRLRNPQLAPKSRV